MKLLHLIHPNYILKKKELKNVKITSLISYFLVFFHVWANGI